jgi:hypothetical protein
MASVTWEVIRIIPKNLAADDKSRRNLAYRGAGQPQKEYARRRKGFLVQVCGGDPELQREVESLLANDVSRDSLLDCPVWTGVGATMTLSPQDPAGAAIPLPAYMAQYRILRIVGQGGMGVVYEAEQQQPRRIVALNHVPESGQGGVGAEIGTVACLITQ